MCIIMAHYFCRSQKRPRQSRTICLSIIEKLIHFQKSRISMLLIRQHLSLQRSIIARHFSNILIQYVSDSLIDQINAKLYQMIMHICSFTIIFSRQKKIKNNKKKLKSHYTKNNRSSFISYDVLTLDSLMMLNHLHHHVAHLSRNQSNQMDLLHVGIGQDHLVVLLDQLLQSHILVSI